MNNVFSNEWGFEYLTSRGASHLFSCSPSWCKSLKRLKGCYRGRHTQPINKPSPYLQLSFLPHRIFPICLSIRKGAFFSSRHFFLRHNGNDSVYSLNNRYFQHFSTVAHADCYRRLRNLIAWSSKNKGIGGSLWCTITTIGEMSLVDANPCFFGL